MSLRRERLSWVFIVALLVVIGTAAYYVVWPQLQPNVTLHLGDGVFNARVISAKEYAKNGMPHTDQLRDGKAVLHMHESDGWWSIDMKQRRAAFDVVWLDSEKKVIYIVKHASADSASGTTFTPKEKARYMIELRGGTVDEKAITINDTAHFDENNIQGLKL